ncbi:hypothetical protein HAX54_010554 [Datura stramonium]|uniref:Uncharacterized protein n=1 Tax=Datura stramonium TaxID=4076 RepID=A0ABS8WYR0_DATST|nr:hypothetical protein [Datura stramonium]
MIGSCFSMDKKPNIFELIQAAVTVGAWKYPAEFKKRKHEILEHLMNPGKVEEDGCDSCVEENHMENTNSAEKQSGKGGADAEIKNMNTTVISKNCNGGGSTRKKHKRPEEFQQSDVGDQKGTTKQSHNINTQQCGSKNCTEGLRKTETDKQLTAKPCSVEGVSRNAAIKRVQIPHHHHHDKQCFGQKRRLQKQSNCNIVAITQTTTED